MKKLILIFALIVANLGFAQTIQITTVDDNTFSMTKGIYTSEFTTNHHAKTTTGQKIRVEMIGTELSDLFNPIIFSEISVDGVVFATPDETVTALNKVIYSSGAADLSALPDYNLEATQLLVLAELQALDTTDLNLEATQLLIKGILDNILIEVQENNQEVTQLQILTEIQALDFSGLNQEVTQLLIQALVDRIAVATESLDAKQLDQQNTTTLVNHSASGTVGAGERFVSFCNIGEADAIVEGQIVKVGETVTYPVLLSTTYHALTFDGTGTILKVLTVK